MSVSEGKVNGRSVPPGMMVWFFALFGLMLTLASGLVHALEVKGVSAQSFPDRVEYRFEFDQPLPLNAQAFLLADPLRQVIDFPEGLNNQAGRLFDGAAEGLATIDLTNSGGSSRLEVFLPKNAETFIARVGKTLILRMGGQPFVDLSNAQTNTAAVDDQLLPEAGGEILDGMLAPVLGQPTTVSVASQPTPGDSDVKVDEIVDAMTAPNGSLLDVRLIRLPQGESLIFEFDVEPVLQGATLDDGLLSLGFSNVGSTRTSGVVPGALFDQLQTLSEADGVSVKLQLLDSEHRIMMSGNRMVVALRPAPQASASLTKPLAVPSEMLPDGSMVEAPSIGYSSEFRPLLIDQSISELDGETIVRLTFDKPIQETVRSFTLTGPDRKVIDLPADITTITQKLSLPENGRILSLETAPGEDFTRLVMNLREPYDVSALSRGDTVDIRLKGPRPYVVDSFQAGDAISKDGNLVEMLDDESVSKLVIDGASLLDVNEGRDEDGADIINLEFDKEDLVARTQRQGDRVRVLIQAAKFTDELAKEVQLASGQYYRNAKMTQGSQSLNLTFDLLKGGIQLRQDGGLLQIAVSGDGFGASDSAGNGSVSSDNNADTLTELALEPRYYGKPISLDFKNAGMQAVMAAFAEFSGMNLVMSESVSGKVTVKLDEVPWDQALDIVMRANGLVARSSGRVLLVSTAEEAEKERNRPSNAEIADGLEPLVARTFLISYQKVENMVGILKDESSNLLSERGHVISDERTSQIFVEDTPRRVNRIASLLRQLDKPVKQVMIEARLVLADSTVSEELNVSLAGGSTSAAGVSGVLPIFGGGDNDGFIDTRAGSSVTGAFTLLNGNGTKFLNIQLKALESDNRARTVSNPRIVTSNKEKARIEQGTEIPYQTVSDGGTTTEFRDASLILDVTPQVAPDGSVLLDVEISKDSVGEVTPDGLAINTRRLETSVSVLDGGTVILGGVFEESKTEGEDKVPFLGDIPVFGNLFKGSAESSEQNELLIFITPVILGEE